MLKEIMSVEALAEIFRKKVFVPRFPAASNRLLWETLLKQPFHQSCAQTYQKAAEEIIKDPNAFPPLKCADYFAFIRNGNRNVFEGFYFARRKNLAFLAMSEACGYSGKYLPAIQEGLWQIMNELVWYLPAHGHYRGTDPMPRFDQPRTDLFCAETGAGLAFLVQLLGKEIGQDSKEMLTWIRELCLERVIKPVEIDGEEPQWWLRGENNWSVWCSNNVASTAFTFLWNEPERLARIIYKLICTCDEFYRRYAPDGGCDEGPSYYQVAGVQFMLFLDLLNFYTDGAYANIYKEEKFRNIGEYIAKVHLTGPWFASMADATAKIPFINPGILNRFAELSQSELLHDFAGKAACGFHNTDNPQPVPLNLNLGTAPKTLMDELRYCFWYPANTARRAARIPRLTVMPDLQCFRFREKDDLTGGTILFLKGGHNAESHNHNDVGQFEVFRNGEPVIIDCGATEYTRFTFSIHRYENNYLNAAGHNVPEINSILQPPGKEFHATLLKSDGCIELELAEAYPPEARVSSCIRRAELEKGTSIITDTIQGPGKLSVRIPLYTTRKPEPSEDGIRLGNMIFSLSGIQLENMETVPVTDSRMKISWGDSLYKIVLAGEYDKQGKWEIRLTPI